MSTNHKKTGLARTANCYGNATMESFLASMKTKACG